MKRIIRLGAGGRLGGYGDMMHPPMAMPRTPPLRPLDKTLTLKDAHQREGIQKYAYTLCQRGYGYPKLEGYFLVLIGIQPP
jgi:hypothetical protein